MKNRPQTDSFSIWLPQRAVEIFLDFTGTPFGRLTGDHKRIGTWYWTNKGICIAQATFNELGQLDGPVYYYGGKTYIRSPYYELYKNGVRLKRVEYFTMTGELATLKHFNLQGQNHGLFKSRMLKGCFKNNKPTGTWTFFSEDTLKVLETIHYKKGVPNGYNTFYWENQGNPIKRARIPLLNGVPQGWATYWNKEGELKGKGYYHKGMLQSFVGNKKECDGETPTMARLFREAMGLKNYLNTQLGLTLNNQQLAAVRKVADRYVKYVNPAVGGWDKI